MMVVSHEDGWQDCLYEDEWVRIEVDCPDCGPSEVPFQFGALLTLNGQALRCPICRVLTDTRVEFSKPH